VEALLAANPGLQPAQLSVGQVLTIPSDSQPAALQLLATPVPVDLGPVVCYPSTGGVDCLASVHNSHSVGLENIMLEITLLGADGQPVEQQVALLPLNLLSPGQTLPALARFPGIASSGQAVVQLKSATFLPSGDPRYLPVLVRDLLVSIDWAGRSAQAQGWISLSEGGRDAHSVWLVVVAYAADEQIVGFRRWEWQGTLPSVDSLPFALTVYSLGPAINRVEILAEVRP
jgi:hypothetical protein